MPTMPLGSARSKASYREIDSKLEILGLKQHLCRRVGFPVSQYRWA
jgi:hypothetical protein